jgi:predicted DNA-binding transcriptional regulator YafY
MPVVKNARLRERTLDQILRNHNRKYSIEELIIQLENSLGERISRSTLYSDFAHMKEEYGADIVRNKDGKYFYQDSDFSIDKAPLDPEDKKLLEMATNIFRIFSSSPIYSKFESTIDKIVTGSKISKTDKKKINCIQPEKANIVIGVLYIEPILNAILDKSSIEIEYQKQGQAPEKKTLSPYLLKQVDQHWYLIAYDNQNSKLIKNYSLDKILSLKLSDEPYKYDSTFDAEEFFKYSYGIYHNYKDTPQKIKLEFKDPYINTIINYPHSPYQTHSLSKDGKKLTVNLELYDSWEIVTEILKYGASVKVLAPKSLGKKIKGIAEEVVKSYK